MEISESRRVLIFSQSSIDAVMGQVFVKRIKVPISRSSAPVSIPSPKTDRPGCWEAKDNRTSKPVIATIIRYRHKLRRIKLSTPGGARWYSR